MLALLAALLLAQTPLFYWVDEQGTVVVTDRLAEVPEPYYGMWRARLRELKAQKARAGEAKGPTSKRPPERRSGATPSAPASGPGAGGSAPSPPPSPGALPTAPLDAPQAAAPQTPGPAPQSVVERELARQRQWRDEVARWREELRLATDALRRAQADLDELETNPVLRATPAYQARIAEAAPALEKARQRVEVARRTLLVELPARAKKESVPPRWLE